MTEGNQKMTDALAKWLSEIKNGWVVGGMDAWGWLAQSGVRRLEACGVNRLARGLRSDAWLTRSVDWLPSPSNGPSIGPSLGLGNWLTDRARHARQLNPTHARRGGNPHTPAHVWSSQPVTRPTPRVHNPTWLSHFLVRSVILLKC
jgi:hypothetical protein